MRTWSPPQVPKIVFLFGFFLLTCGTVHGEVFVLPDLVIISKAEPDIPLPNLFPDLTETWTPNPPQYRRQYKIPVEDYLNPPKSLPDNLPVVDPMADTGALLLMVDTGALLLMVDTGALLLLEDVASTELRSTQLREWGIGVISDIQEGIDLGVSYTFENLGEIGGTIFAPFPEISSRPWSGEIGWERKGRFSNTVKIGVKEDSPMLPYLVAGLNWNRGLNQPNNYFLELYHFGSSAHHLSILGGIDLSFRFKESNWSIITKIEGGLLHTVSITEGSARGVFAIGLNLFDYGLRSNIGVDIAYGDSGKIRSMPFLGLNWLVDDNISVYAHAEIFMRYSDNLGSVFFRERINSFEAQMPIHSRYQLGIAQIGETRVSYLLEISYAEGSFCEMENRIIVGRDDRRIHGLGSIGYNFGTRRINLSGELDFSLLGFTEVWESRIELTGEKLSYYIFGGSQDAILAGFFGGSRGEEIIIGFGLNWKISENWRVGASTYANMPWSRPSLKLTATWKNTGVINE